MKNSSNLKTININDPHSGDEGVDLIINHGKPNTIYKCQYDSLRPEQYNRLLVCEKQK